MWDVVWTDPEKISRREHRERKATRPVRDKTLPSSRSVFSRGSVSSSEGPGLSGRRAAEESIRSLSPTLSYTHTSVNAADYDLESDRCSKSSVSDESTPAILARSPDSVTDLVLLPKQGAECTVGSWPCAMLVSLGLSCTLHMN